MEVGNSVASGVGLAQHVVLCGVVWGHRLCVCNDRQNYCSLGGHRKRGGGGELRSSPCSWEPLDQQSGPQCRGGRKESNWRQISFLAVGPPSEASTLLRRRINEGWALGGGGLCRDPSSQLLPPACGHFRKLGGMVLPWGLSWPPGRMVIPTAQAL